MDGGVIWLGKFKDLTGQRFGYLTVVKRVEDYISPNGNHRVQWLCKCDCGNEVVVLGNNLSKHSTESCGCLRKNPSLIIRRKYNTYDLSRNYGIGYTQKGEEFYFDLEDYNKIKDYYWFQNDAGYIVTTLKKINGKQKRIRMHNFLMGEFDIDHRNNNKADNRNSNLRQATVSQNIMNRATRQDNSSGCTGVYWNKQKNKWAAKIILNGKQIHLGFFSNIEDAIQTRKEAEDKYFGEFSYDNSQSYIIK